MEAVPIYIALGSNIEPRREYLAQARAMLSGISQGNWAESSIHETDPVGPNGQDRYLNQVVAFDCHLSAESLLHFCKGVEVTLGRKPRGRWEAREIDLDVLYRGQEIRTKGSPILPHPRIAERSFVLAPLCEIAPDWIDPVHRTTVHALHEKLLNPSSGTRLEAP